MKRIPESYKSAPVDSYSREIAVCRCGGTLHFDTDHEFGYTIETCDRCKVTRPMQRAPRREELDPLPVTVKVIVIRPCEDCGGAVQFSGMGSVPKRCGVCAQKRRRRQAREWKKRRAA